MDCSHDASDEGGFDAGGNGVVRGIKAILEEEEEVNACDTDDGEQEDGDGVGVVEGVETAVANEAIDNPFDDES